MSLIGVMLMMSQEQDRSCDDPPQSDDRPSSDTQKTHKESFTKQATEQRTLAAYLRYRANEEIQCTVESKISHGHANRARDSAIVNLSRGMN